MPNDTPSFALTHSVSTAAATEPLFQPIRVGTSQLLHRVAMAPLTRVRATAEHVPTELMVKMYEQRASTPGTLLVTEATLIDPRAGGYRNVPGIWNETQVAAWKNVGLI